MEMILRVATNLNPPHVFIDYEHSKNAWVLSGGYEVEIIKVLGKQFNSTYQIINCNSDWGIQLPNKTWTGIIGRIASKFSDIGVSALSVTYDRSQVVDFLNPHFITTVSFITSIPKTKRNITLIIEPFEYLVWISFIISLIIILLYEWILSQFCIQLKKIDIKWAIISASLRQQFPCFLPYVLHLRIILSCWLLGCLVLTSSYSGCLHSLMAFPPIMKAIDTVEQLAIAQKSGEIQVISTKSSSHYQLIKMAKSGVLQEIGASIKTVPNKKKALEIVRNSTKAHAFISTRDFLTYERLRSSHEPFYLPPPNDESALNLDIRAIAVQKKFKYKKFFNKIISDIVKGGLVNYWHYCEIRKIKKYQDLYYPREADNLNDRIDLRKLQSLSYLVTIAFLVSLSIFIIELLFNHTSICTQHFSQNC